MFFKAFPLLIVALMSIGAVLQKDQKFSSQEKRELKTLDDINFKINNIQNIPSELDTYFTDQAFLKSYLFNLYTRFKLAVRDSPSADVTLGKDGWFFLGSPISKKYANLINYSSKILPVPGPSNYLQNKSELKSSLNSKGIDYLYIVAPDKSSIYPEYLPDQYHQFNLRRQSLSASIGAQFADELGLSFLNLKEDLLKSKVGSDKPLYYLWDTHWNPRGASISEVAIAERLKLIANDSSLNVKQVDVAINNNKTYIGDLAKFAGATHLSEDVLYAKPNNSLSVKCHEGKLGNRSLDCAGGAEAMRILLVRDSFSGSLIPFMSQRYSNIYAAWEYPSNARILDLIQETNPDIVIEQVVEREFLYFSGVPRIPL